MIELSALAAAATVAGAALAVGGRDRRAVLPGLVVAMLCAPFSVAPLPSPLALAARLSGALLAADLVWVLARVKGWQPSWNSLGLAGSAALAAAAFVVGLWLEPVKPLPGGSAAQAAGLALVVLALGPLASSDPTRLGIGATVLTLGAVELARSWIGAAPALEDLMVALLLVALLGTTGLLMVPAALTKPAPGESGGLDEAGLKLTPAVRVPTGGSGSIERGSHRAGRPTQSEAREPGGEDSPAEDAAELWDRPLPPGRPARPEVPRFGAPGPHVRRTRHPRDIGPSR